MLRILGGLGRSNEGGQIVVDQLSLAYSSRAIMRFIIRFYRRSQVPILPSLTLFLTASLVSAQPGNVDAANAPEEAPKSTVEPADTEEGSDETPQEREMPRKAAPDGRANEVEKDDPPGSAPNENPSAPENGAPSTKDEEEPSEGEPRATQDGKAASPPRKVPRVILEEEPKEELERENFAETHERAITKYVVGEIDEALTDLKRLLSACLSGEHVRCTEKTTAILYRDIAIVLAGGKNAHAAAVRTFRRALYQDANLTIPGDLRSPAVDRAYREAGGRRIPAKRHATTDSPRTWESDSQEQNAEEGPGTRALVLLEGSLKPGSAFVQGESLGLLQMGPQLTFAAAWEAGFVLGGRARFNHYEVLDFPGSTGSWGLSTMLGGAFGHTPEGHFQYLLGGLGFEHFPTSGAAASAFHMSYGGSLGGFGLGLGIDFIVNDPEVDVVAGFTIGYAGLL